MLSRKNYEFAYKLFCLLEPLSLAPGCLLPSCYVHTNLYIATHPMHSQTCLDMLHVGCRHGCVWCCRHQHTPSCTWWSACTNCVRSAQAPQPSSTYVSGKCPCTRSLNFPICISICIWGKLTVAYVAYVAASQTSASSFECLFPRESSPLPLPTCESATGMATLVSDCCHFGLQITGEDSWRLSRFAKYSEANLGRTRNLDLFQRYEATNIKVLKKCCLNENTNPIIGFKKARGRWNGHTMLASTHHFRIFVRYHMTIWYSMIS